jgi:thiamine biosynthesis protein ThiS
MQIKVNGECRAFESPLCVQALVERLSLNPKQVAVERNRQIVPRSQYGEMLLSDGDEIEIVHFIGGG